MISANTFSSACFLVGHVFQEQFSVTYALKLDVAIDISVHDGLTATLSWRAVFLFI